VAAAMEECWAEAVCCRSGGRLMKTSSHFVWRRGQGRRLVPVSRLAQALVTGLAAALLVALAGSLGWTQSLERQSLDGLFGARGPRWPDPKIVIIVADNESVARINQWPLPRRLYAQVVRELHRQGARTIAIDALFPTLSERPAEDAEFAAACREAGNVVQAAAFHIAGFSSAPLSVNLPGDRTGLEERFRLRGQGNALDAVWVSAALPALRQSAPALGHVTVFPEPDGTLRRIPHVVRYRGHPFPSLALAAATSYQGVKPQQIQWSEEGLSWTGRDGARRVPLDEYGEGIVNWVGGNNSFPTFSVNQLLDGHVRPEALKDSLVFVGVTAAGAYEQRATPFSPNQPAVELQANAADDILQDRPLRECGAAQRWLLLLGFAIACAMAATRLGWGSVLWFGALVFTLWQHALISLRADVWVPFGAPLFAGAVAWVTTVATGYSQEWEANRRADAALSALARGGALLATEGDVCRLREVICDTAREALGAQSVYVIFEGEKAAAPPDVAPLVRQIATFAVQEGKVLRHPTGDRRAGRQQVARLAQLIYKSTGPFLAAPLPRRVVRQNASLVPSGGVLVALRGETRLPFTSRDAALLETIAEQAALALSNLEYYKLLRGEIELADENLLRANALLGEQSAKLTAAVESIHSALIVTDEKGDTVFFNSATAQVLHGAPPLGQSLAVYLREADLPTLAQMCETAITAVRNGELSDEQRCEAEIAPADPRLPRVILEAQLQPLHGADGEFIGLMLAVADVTAQRELDDMKTNFVSFVAHELRSPLTSILGYSSLMHSGGERIDAAMRAEMSEAILRQGRRLNRLISELLDVSRLEAGKTLDLQKGPVNLTELCRNVLDAQRAASGQSVACEFDFLAPEGVAVIGDTDRLEQVLVNLVSNAVKYSPRGGRVLLKIEEEPGRVLIRVSDDGMGMNAEEMSGLFQKFYRTSEARRRGIKGTGLGLFLVKQLVEAHGGTIEVQSAPGEGSTFTVCLPKS
jgi:signal transduction histidine kinase/CHASE2 domain-containing sensor protein/GAF domain-containing protein